MFYEYTAVNLEGKRTKGICEAEDEADLYRRLKQSEFFLINSSAKNTYNGLLSRSADIKTIVILCKQLFTLVHSGVELTEAINTCSGLCRRSEYRLSLQHAYIGLLKGDRLSFCLRKYSKLYPKFMIDMIEIGEETGTLTEVLNKISSYYYKQMKLNNKIRTSLSYPIILLICTIIVSLIVTTKIIPEFKNVMSTTGSEMPGITNIFFSFNNFCSTHLTLIMLVLVFTVLLLRYYLSTERGIKILSKIQLSIFPINKLYLELSQIKITGSMYILLSSGLNPIKALKISGNVLRNIILKQRITTCIEDIKKGKSFSKALEDTDIFDSAFISMVKVGEETGSINETIEEVITINEDSMEENINRVVMLIEPVMVIISAIIITFIVFAALLPALNIMDSLGG